MNRPAFQPIVEFLTGHRDRGTFPGASVIICLGGTILFRRGFGVPDPEKPDNTADPSTIYDIASLTKPVATTTSILRLCQAGILELESPVFRILDELNSPDKRSITIRQLLTHTSGLPAWKPLYLEAEDTAGMIDAIARTPLKAQPGSEVIYSCPGYILLGEIVRRLTGRSLTSHTRSDIFQPLLMNDTMFNPPARLKRRIAPTEMGNRTERDMAGESGRFYTGWRRHRLHGEVQDGNAYTARGEGGNAGLFSTADDLLRFGRCILNGGILDGIRILDEKSVRESVRNQTPGLNASRGLGWQMACSSVSTGGALSDRAFGHNGFSGTSFWIDPARDLIIILLTNRSYHGGSGEGFNRVRAAFHSLAVQCSIGA
ncbi:beta-lactamase family protein [bacterium]|nr:beta-lactamase family protein [candidate division CSSED10-310 bacterium]